MASVSLETTTGKTTNTRAILTTNTFATESNGELIGASIHSTPNAAATAAAHETSSPVVVDGFTVPSVSIATKGIDKSSSASEANIVTTSTLSSLATAVENRTFEANTNTVASTYQVVDNSDTTITTVTILPNTTAKSVSASYIVDSTLFKTISQQSEATTSTTMEYSTSSSLPNTFPAATTEEQAVTVTSFQGDTTYKTYTMAIGNTSFAGVTQNSVDGTTTTLSVTSDMGAVTTITPGIPGEPNYIDCL